MRGKGFKIRFVNGKFRITPAYAGKSSIVSPSSAVDWDHPRLCGEKFQKNRRSPCYKGSPPPMRGKVCFKLKRVLSFGITPAYAGKRFGAIKRVRRRRDHPRLCGEKRLSIQSKIESIGSPPPMRGKDKCHFILITQSRITPAYAGKRDFWL